jgi:hypothetical protein
MLPRDSCRVQATANRNKFYEKLGFQRLAAIPNYPQGHENILRDFRPAVYHALRKSLFGDATQLAPGDLVDNIDVAPLPKQQ